jgi:AAA-like domain/TIR domain
MISSNPSSRTRVFISYKRNVEPDHPLATRVYNELRKNYDVFIDQAMLVGTRWAERIEAELHQTDFLIVFLSTHSVHSEMVLAEITAAFDIARSCNGRPAILPVRVAYHEPFQYPLSAYLSAINWAFWETDQDTARLIDELRQAISQGALSAEQQPVHASPAQENASLLEPSASAQPLEMPEGTMDPDSRLYIERPGDSIALNAIQREGVTITIKGPRQMGKSSLLNRIMATATKAGKRVAFLDFQLFDKPALLSADTFFPQFCSWLTDELGMENRLDEHWKLPLGNSQRTTRYIGRYLLEALNGPLLLGMDEVETVFDTDFRSDFFSMLRNWHNSRRSGSIWKRLDLALVTSTEPYQFINNLNQSPFNVGEVIELSDFSLEQLDDLNGRHGSSLSGPQLESLMTLLNGHPYLTRRALYLIASGHISVPDLFAKAADDRGPFGDHLRYHLFRLHGNADLVQGLLQVIQAHVCPDDQIFFRLRGAGLVKREGHTVLPRCQLYATFFQEQLND